MVIPPTGGPNRPASPTPRRGADGAGFSLPAAHAGPEPAPSPSLTRLTGLSPLLAVQAEAGLDRRGRQLRRGARTLDGLEGLQRALLGLHGADAAAMTLAQEAEPLEPTGDPGLDEALAYLEERRCVELAKREVAARRAAGLA